LGVVLEFLFVLALAAAHDRRQHHHAILRLSGEHGLHDLFGGLPRDRAAAIRTVRRANGAIEDAEIVVDFRDRADGGPRGAGGGLLLDCNRGRKAFDRIHVGALHLIEKLARVGGKGFHVAALSLGIEGIEGEGGFSRTGQSGNHGEGVARDFEVDILEVVLTRAPNDDFLQTHSNFEPAAAPPLDRRGTRYTVENKASVAYEHSKLAQQGSRHVSGVSRRSFAAARQVRLRHTPTAARQAKKIQGSHGPNSTRRALGGGRADLTSASVKCCRRKISTANFSARRDFLPVTRDTS